MTRLTSRRAAALTAPGLGLALAAGLLTLAQAAHAQHPRLPGQDGIDVTTSETISSGSYTGVNRGGGGGYGIAVMGPVDVTISGGTFAGGDYYGPEYPGGYGLLADGGATVTITGGTITGGFDTIYYESLHGSLTTYSADLYADNAALTLDGDFTYGGLADYSGLVAPGLGSFSGTLTDNGGAAQVFHYDALDGGTITLVSTPAPEPSAFAGLALGALGLAALALKSGVKARRRA